MVERPPSAEIVSLQQAIVLHEGVTTAIGAALGMSIKDAGLAGIGVNSYKNSIVQIYPDDTTRVDAQVATAFDNVNEITVESAFKGGVVPAGVPYKVIVSNAMIAQILGIVKSIAGGSYWQPFGPGNVQVTNAVTIGVTVFDPGGGIIPLADITAGTYTIDRIRLGVLTPAIAAGASNKVNGAVYVNYAFPAISWAIGDLFVVTFTGISVSIGGIVTNFPPIQVWGRVVMEPDIDTVVNNINTNLVALGVAWSLQTNNQPVRTNLQQTINDINQALGIDGVNAFDPNIMGAVRADLVAALAQLAVYFKAGGAAFNPTVNGFARADVTDAFTQLAAYFNAAAIALAVTIDNGGAARSNLNDILNDLGAMLAGGAGITTFPAAANIGNGVSFAEAIRAILTSLVGGDNFAAYTNINGVARTSVNTAFQGIASVLGADAANVFNPTIQGVGQTDLDAALAQLAVYFNLAGAVLAVTMNPGAGARANLQLILQDLGDMLAGGAGIVTYPAAAAPGNGVGIAQVLRQIYDDVIALTGTGILHEQADVPFSVDAALAEVNVFSLAAANTRYVVRSLRLKCVDPGAETVTVRLYELVNNGQILVDTFAITGGGAGVGNWETYHSLMDMFGLPQLAGDNLKVAVIATAAGPYTCIGQYCTATATI